MLKKITLFDIGLNASKFITENLFLEIIGYKMFQRLEFITKKFIKNYKQESLEKNSLIENEILKNKIKYLEKTFYNKIRKKINAFFSK